MISKEPLGPMVRHGDDQWFDLVKWTLFAMINAEDSASLKKISTRWPNLTIRN